MNAGWDVLLSIGKLSNLIPTWAGAALGGLVLVLLIAKELLRAYDPSFFPLHRAWWVAFNRISVSLLALYGLVLVIRFAGFLR